MSGLTLHASAVAIGGAGLLITGAAGSGKSALAAELIARGAGLIADDRVALARDEGRVLLSPPGSIAGLLELRGIGIVRLPSQSRVPLRLIADLDAKSMERLPKLAQMALLDSPFRSISCGAWRAGGSGGLPHLAALLTVVMQAGDLVDPELAIGRLACETGSGEPENDAG